MTAAGVLKEAADCGVLVNLNGDSLALKATTKPPASLLAKLKEHKVEIVALLRQETEAAGAATSRPSWWPKPHLRIVREPPFGSDGAPPERYRAAWGGLLAQCPSGMAPFVWETAMYDAARLFGDFGIELERLAWKPDDLFGMPHGVVWFIKGNYAAAIGATMAQLGNGRIWMAAR
jgi:hypothetical protein